MTEDEEFEALEQRLNYKPETPASKPVIDKSAAIRIATALGWAPRREWVGLTDEDIAEAMTYWSSDKHSAYGGAEAAAGEYFDVEESWRYIEAKLREKNERGLT